ncbi:MAG: isopenicillin N synthase family oxygenase [Betaproteobacteria bacterium]|nr:isopenicillin N synthase family oxygenase [Betaproteobacteria bacterium]
MFCGGQPILARSLMSEQIPRIRLDALDEPPNVLLLKEAYERLGFVVITEHGINATMIDPFLAMFQDFFSWPQQRKLDFRLAGAAGARGYTPFGVETAKGSDWVDLKEFWHIGRELEHDHSYRRYMPENVWIDAIAGFKRRCLEVFEAFDRTGCQILRAIASVLELPADFFEDKVNMGNSVLRVIHYPPLPAGPTKSLREPLQRFWLTIICKSACVRSA